MALFCMSDCPSSVTVSPSSGPFKAGDVLTCSSDGYPEPSYYWNDKVTGLDEFFDTPATLVGGWFHFTCTAYDIFKTPCIAVSNSVSGYATGKTKKMGANCRHFMRLSA